MATTNKKPKRQSRPTYWQPYSAGALGLIPRRSLPVSCTGSGGILDANALERLARSRTYQRLFELLLDIHPALKQAKSNALRLVFGEGKTRFVAYTEIASGGNDEQDAALTSEIEDFFKSLPNEIGGVVGLQSTLAIHALAHGLTALEAVPGPRGVGLSRLWPIDPLTLGLFRPGGDVDADLGCYQRQSGTGVPASGWVEMPKETFFWQAIDATPDNPYGAGLFSAAFGQALADFTTNQDLRDAVHNAAWPRYDYEYDVERITARAVSLGLDNNAPDAETELTALESYVKRQVDAIEDSIGEQLADDNYVHSSDMSVKTLDGGDFGGLDEVLKIERHRLVQSLDELPTLMGINDGSTQTYTSVEWGIRATKAAWLRDWVNTPLIWALELHFRLQGKRVTVRAICEPVRASDAEADARTEAIKDRTQANRTRRGLQTLEDEAQNTTGTGLPAEAEAKARQKVAQEDTTTTPGSAPSGTGAS